MGGTGVLKSHIHSQICSAGAHSSLQVKVGGTIIIVVR